jgi:hypothetical protein
MITYDFIFHLVLQKRYTLLAGNTVVKKYDMYEGYSRFKLDSVSIEGRINASLVTITSKWQFVGAHNGILSLTAD